MTTYAVPAPPVTCPNCGFGLVPPPPPLPPESPTPYAEPYPAPYPAPPSPAPRERTGVRAASVPQILLGLGAFCLLVAAVIFLAVAWSWLGVGGRTATLVGLTAASGLGGHWFARRRLPLAAEALTTVALGLVVLDAFGARFAGWLDVGSDGGFVTLVGALLCAAGLAFVAVDRLVAGQLGSVLGLAVVALGVEWWTGRGQLVAAAAVIGFVALAVAGRGLRTLVLPWVAGAASAFAWVVLALLGLADAVGHPTLAGLWPGRHGWGLLTAAALLLPVAATRAPSELRQAALATAATALTVVATIPTLDNGVTPIALAALAATLVWAAVATVTPPRWYAVPRVPLLGAAAVVAVVVALLAATALLSLIAVGAPFSAGAGVRVSPADAVASAYLLPLGVAGLIAAGLLALPRRSELAVVAAGALGLAGLLTLALFPVPLWLPVAVAAIGSAGLLVAALRHDGTRGAGEAVGSAVIAGAATAVALPSAALTTAVLVAVVTGAIAVLARGRFPGAIAGASLVLPVAVTALIVAAGEVADLSWTYRSIAALVVVGLLTVQRPRVETETAGWLSVTLVSAAGIAAAPDLSFALALHLTLAGVIVCASALTHTDRRELGWVGGVLLAAATWVRLADLGVTAPEAYTLPSAAVLLWFGLRRLNRSDDASTLGALGSALALATVPTLLWVLVDPVSLRAVLLGGACLALVIAGAQLWWNAPLVVGGLVGVAVVLRELAPYALHTPQWVLIGVAGAALIGVGVTWEARVRDLHRTAAWLGRLR